MKTLLRTVIADQTEARVAIEGTVPRAIPSHLLDTREVVIISGIRRCGKSVLLHQLRSRLPEKDYYLNFDDERLIRFTVDDFKTLHELFIELFGVQKTFFFDEIQNVKGWERFVRRLRDAGNKVFITGSNATMLSREMGTHLTGRYLRHELYPFSFREYLLSVEGVCPDETPYGTAAKARLRAHFGDYFRQGGFPVFLQTKDPSVLRTLAESILYRDVMVRNHLTNEREILELVFYLASNVAKRASYSSLAKVIGVKNATTVKNYMSFLRDSYLAFQVGKYDHSVKKQLQNERKMYLIDNGLVDKLGFAFSENTGHLLENLVFVELQRRNGEVYYHARERECDFLVCEGWRVSESIQVCAAFENEKTRIREVEGLMDAMEAYSLSRGIIVTLDDEGEETILGKTVTYMPAWKWALR